MTIESGNELLRLETRRFVWNSAEILLTGTIGVQEPGCERTKRSHGSKHSKMKRRGVALCKRNTPELDPSAKQHVCAFWPMVSWECGRVGELRRTVNPLPYG